MTVETHEVRDLADFAPEGFLVTSFYLDVNADEFPDPEHIKKSLDSLKHEAEAKREDVAKSLSHDASESLRSDLKEIEEYVTNDFERDDANSVAIFSCSAQGFWQVIPMPTKLTNLVEFGPRPYLTPIARFLSHTKPTAILVTDREQARIITMKGSEVREWANLEDFVPQRSDQGGWSQMRYQRRSDNWAQHHVDHATELVLRLKNAYPFDWLILGVDKDALHDVRESLHPYLRDLIIGEIHVRIDAPVAEIVDKASQVREEAESRHIDQLIQQVQEYAGAGGRGTIGLPATLEALNEQKVHILLVQDGAHAAGAICPGCGFLTLEQQGSCPACGESLVLVDNVYDAAIQKALELGSTVEVATEFEKLAPIQNIGSIMYY